MAEAISVINGLLSNAITTGICYFDVGVFDLSVSNESSREVLHHPVPLDITGVYFQFPTSLDKFYAVGFSEADITNMQYNGTVLYPPGSSGSGCTAKGVISDGYLSITFYKLNSSISVFSTGTPKVSALLIILRSPMV